MAEPTDFQKKFSGFWDDQDRSVRGLRSWSLKTAKKQVAMREPQRRKGFADYIADPFVIPDLLPSFIQRTVSTTKMIGHTGFVWEEGWNFATCTKSVSHIAPEPGCTCGFYAYFTANPGRVLMSNHFSAIGVIEGYGQTTVGPLGFRTQRAKILSIWPIRASYAAWPPVRKSAGQCIITPLPGSDPTVGHIRAEYPDVAIFDDFSTMIAEFPPSEPPNL